MSSPITNPDDDLFNYDVGLDEILQNIPKPAGQQPAVQPPSSDPAEPVLGLDEEVKPTRRRRQVAKLDEERLLSQRGIPRLQKIAKSKLRFKGKGHEFSDLERLLTLYQLWLDDLYPRAKFSDGLAIIEKLGHSKRLQIMRREWIDAEKPRPRETTPVSTVSPEPRQERQQQQQQQQQELDLFQSLENRTNQNQDRDQGSEDEDLFVEAGDDRPAPPAGTESADQLRREVDMVLEDLENMDDMDDDLPG
ncbi:hypothetical protein VTN49DRAFT_6576 [Thermomyces lanuginosus]|uniref:uncharacterized protein n=1 Tax=Thermomyces lanuginosus TaxID=5541 RepID=UPI003744AFBA